METGELPTPRYAPRAAVVDNVIYVTGGELTAHEANGFFTEILSWDPSTESWQQAGNLAVARYYYAAAAIPSSLIESGCSVLLRYFIK